MSPGQPSWYVIGGSHVHAGMMSFERDVSYVPIGDRRRHPRGRGLSAWTRLRMRLAVHRLVHSRPTYRG